MPFQSTLKHALVYEVMPREMVVLRLLRPEAEAVGQGLEVGIRSLLEGCPECKKAGRYGCPLHTQGISRLRELKRRFRFTEE